MSADVYVVETPKGSTESFGAREIQTLVDLGLIQYERSNHVMSSSDGPVGPMHHFYSEARHD